MTSNNAEAGGPKVLVVEDQMLIATSICDAIEDHGYRIVGPTGKLAKGMLLARDAQLSAAVLDVNLAGELSFAIARILIERGVPVLFLTGYADQDFFPSELQSVPKLQKPFDLAVLVEKLDEIVGPPRHAPAAGAQAQGIS